MAAKVKKDDEMIVQENGNGAIEKPKKMEERFSLIDRVIGEGKKSIRLQIFADEVTEVVNDYHRKLLRVRGVPQDIVNVPPTDVVLQWVLQQPEIREIEDDQDKAEYVLAEVQDFYEKVSQRTMADATILAMVQNNEFTEPPLPYPEEEALARPGMMAMPNIIINLKIPLEKRLKQALDLLSSIEGAMSVVTSEMRTMNVRAAMYADKHIDKDGFRTGATD